ncbi:MAG: 1-acyl-sn-glycerol-3-phosphate acyltransferase [Anaerolineae bacterium]|nr:1-acyl-sn-glycerol-3-phosphate acyltransferase [Anaerolineae bacterium]
MKTSKLIARRVINFAARALTDLVCKIDAGGLKRLPAKGPYIIIVNHVNFLELPIIYPRVGSDLGTGYSKVENWDNWLYRLLFRNWNIIPIDREEVDVSAMRQGFQALDKGMILFVTPEGTRSHDGRLHQGKPGVAMLAERTGVPVWPVACYGGENFSENIRRLRRTEYHVKVGNPFTVGTNGIKAAGAVRQQIVDEMMYQIAALLPAQHRGYYSDIAAATESFLTFPSPGDSNLRQVHGQPKTAAPLSRVTAA